MKSQATAFAKWKKGVATGVDAYKSGVRAPRKPWGAATAESAHRWATNVAQAASDGRFAKRVSNPASQTKWENGSLNKGSTRWQSSVNDATVQANYQAGLNVLYGYLDTANGVVGKMPADTDAERDARMLAYVDSVRKSAAARKASGA